MRFPFFFMAALLLLAVASIFFAVSTGSIQLDWFDTWQAVVNSEAGINHAIIYELRLPRALSAFLTGAMLALAGGLMQVLLRNPLADPYILGVSGGAAVATLCGIILGLGNFWLTGSAFAGALLSTFLVFGLAHNNGNWTTTRLLLTGVIIASGWGALISFLLSIAPDANLRGMLFWLMGDLAHADNPLPAFIVLVVCFFACFPFARALNVLSRGELQASSLGVNVARIRISIYFIASLLTASAVTLAGSIGFIGLIIPHILRMIIGNDYRILLPASVLAGGLFLVIADTISRTILSPQQLPVGVITAMLGVPFFLYLLARGRQYA